MCHSLGTHRDGWKDRRIGVGFSKPDYVADCLFDPNAPSKPLCIVGRKGTGGAALLEIGKGGFESSPLASFPVVHTDSIRSCAAAEASLITGGEDGRICLWNCERLTTFDGDEDGDNDDNDGGDENRHDSMEL